MKIEQIAPDMRSGDEDDGIDLAISRGEEMERGDAMPVPFDEVMRRLREDRG